MAERLDVYLVSKGLARSRERAKQMIKNGSVNVNGNTASKPSLLIETTDEVTASEDLGYVGRGALKLIKAFEAKTADIIPVEPQLSKNGSVRTSNNIYKNI